MSHSDSPCAHVADDDTTQGQVKWFNSSSGYGFITYTDEGAEKDVFVHHTALKTRVDQYKYLVQGEYVEFDIDSATEGRVQAKSVTGIKRGPLMCESNKNNNLNIIRSKWTKKSQDGEEENLNETM